MAIVPPLLLRNQSENSDLFGITLEQNVFHFMV